MNNSGIAQSVERKPEELRVGGSSPSPGTKYKRDPHAAGYKIGEAENKVNGSLPFHPAPRFVGG